MPRYNYHIYLRQGEANITRTFTFYDDNGQPLNLSDPGWSARVLAGKKDETKIIDTAMAIVADQETLTGKIRYTFTSVDCSHPVDQYEVSVIISHTDGRKYEYPKNAGGTFATLHILRSKTTS